MKSKVFNRKECIAVVCGGKSAERNISLKSGRAVHQALIALGQKTLFIDLEEENIEPIKSSKVKHVFLALHGAYGEDGRIQAELDATGIRYTGSGPEACHKSMNKEATRLELRKAGLSEPSWKVIRRSEYSPGNRIDMKYPFFVKPLCGGSSIGVVMVENETQEQSALETALNEDGEAAIVESKIQGREIAVGILGDAALEPIEIIPAGPFYDYDSKYISNKTRYEFLGDLSDFEKDAIKTHALKAYHALHCRAFSRVDLIYSPNQTIVLELNSIPGLTERSLLPKAAEHEGISFPQLCDIIISESFQIHRENPNNATSKT